MNWTPDERSAAQRRAEAVFIGASKWDDDVRADCDSRGVTEDLRHVAHAMLDHAAELLAARGGTMTAEQVARALNSLWHESDEDKRRDLHFRAWHHFASQGAEVARLQARVAEETGRADTLHRTWERAEQENTALRDHLADLTEILCGERPIGVMAETTKDAARALKAKAASLENPRCFREACVRERERVDYLEVALSERTKTYQQAAQERDAAQAEVARYVEAARHDQQTVDVLRAELARLKAELKKHVARGALGLPNPPTSSESSGRVVEAVVEITALMERPAPDRRHPAWAALSRLAALAQQGQEAHAGCPDNPCPGHHPYCEGAGKDTDPPQAAPVAGAPWRCREGTCGHKDAGRPEHAPEAEERSQDVHPEALPEGPLEVQYPPDDGLRELASYERGKNDGAEAMRAAAIRAVLSLCDLEGLPRGQAERFKAAIEGAAP